VTDSEPKLTPLDSDSYDAIIFDLGGVILPLKYGATIARLTELLGRDAREIYQETVQSAFFDGLERGESSAATFRERLRAESRAERPIADAEIDDAFNALLGRIPDEHLMLLAALGKQKRLFLLSNTNSIHIAQFHKEYEERHAAQFGPFSALFERDYYSHEIGLRKPDPRSFQHIFDAHGLSQQRTVFIDDNEHNVMAGAKLGMQSLLHPRNHSLLGYFART
jgi:glucose-1-phosphatase